MIYEKLLFSIDSYLNFHFHVFIETDSYLYIHTIISKAHFYDLFKFQTPVLHTYSSYTFRTNHGQTCHR